MQYYNHSANCPWNATVPKEVFTVLLSMPTGRDTHAFAYLMTNDPTAIERAVMQMVDAVEAAGFHIIVPAVAQTTLDAASAERVKKWLLANCAKARRDMPRAKNYYLNSWGMYNQHPDAEWLLALH